MSDEQDVFDDVVVSLVGYTSPALETALLIKKQLGVGGGPAFNQAEFERRFPAPRRLDLGSGTTRESGWVTVDCDPKVKPDLLADAHALPLADSCVHEVRAVFAMSAFADPTQVLREAWRVMVPNAILHVVDVVPGADNAHAPGVRHVFSRSHWERTGGAQSSSFIPSGARGGWVLMSYEQDFNAQTGERLCMKLKLTREQVMATFRNVSSRQTVKLQKRT